MTRRGWAVISVLACIALAMQALPAPAEPTHIQVERTDAPRGMSGNQCRQVQTYLFVCHGDPPYDLFFSRDFAPGPPARGGDDLLGRATAIAWTPCYTWTPCWRWRE